MTVYETEADDKGSCLVRRRGVLVGYVVRSAAGYAAYSRDGHKSSFLKREASAGFALDAIIDATGGPAE